jgi:hypothetical protein
LVGRADVDPDMRFNSATQAARIADVWTGSDQAAKLVVAAIWFIAFSAEKEHEPWAEHWVNRW